MYEQDLEDAYNEAKVYANIGGLDDTMLEDIAFDHKVTMRDLKEKLGWD